MTEFKFSSEIGRVFRGNNAMRWLVNWGPEWGFVASHLAFVFVDNHDNQRGGDPILTYKQAKPYKMATAFALSHPFGVVRMMSSFHFDNNDQGPPQNGNGEIISPSINGDGTCGNGWVCEHRWRQIYHMVGFRNEVANTQLHSFWHNGDNQIAFCRGNKGFIAFNLQGHPLNEWLQTCLPQGTYCDIISGQNNNGQCTGRSITVDFGGFAQIFIDNNAEDGVVAYHTGSVVSTKFLNFVLNGFLKLT